MSNSSRRGTCTLEEAALEGDEGQLGPTPSQFRLVGVRRPLHALSVISEVTVSCFYSFLLSGIACFSVTACHIRIATLTSSKSSFRESPPTALDLQCAAVGRDPVAVEESDTGTEPDEGAPPLGSGWLGHGPPQQVGQGPKRRDGAGLCSPGRCAPRHRQLPETAVLKEVRCEICQFADTLLRIGVRGSTIS